MAISVPARSLRLGGVLAALLLCARCAGEPLPRVYGPGELPPQFTDEERARHTIVLVGDIMPWDRSADLLRRHGPHYPFHALLPLVAGADWAVGNLEAPVAETAVRRPAEYSYRVPPFALAGLRAAGFDLLGIANNHIMDCGPEGLEETLHHLDRFGMGGFGAGPNLARAARASVVRIGATRVAFVAAICPETYADNAVVARETGKYEAHAHAMREQMGATSSGPGIVIATPQSVAELVCRAVPQAELVVAFLHFGVRYQRAPTERQRALARAAVLAGADLVVGHHAHVWQPVEIFRGVPVFYGLGNLAFGSANRRADQGLLLRANLHQGRFSTIEIFPLCTRNRDEDINYQTKVFSDADARLVIAQLAEHSAAFGAKVAYRDGRGVLEP